MNNKSYLILEDVISEAGKWVSLEVSGDTIYLDFSSVELFNIHDDSKKDSTKKALKNAAGFIRKELMERVEIRYVPELEFIYDESIEYGKKIENIIEEIHKEDIEK